VPIAVTNTPDLLGFAPQEHAGSIAENVAAGYGAFGNYMRGANRYTS